MMSAQMEKRKHNLEDVCNPSSIPIDPTYLGAASVTTLFSDTDLTFKIGP